MSGHRLDRLFSVISALVAFFIVILMIVAVILPDDREISAGKIAKHKQEQLHKAQADSIKAAQEKLRLAQIDTLFSTKHGDMITFGDVKSTSIVDINTRDNLLVLEIGSGSAVGHGKVTPELIGYKPDLKIVRWNTAKWHQLMADAWKP